MRCCIRLRKAVDKVNHYKLCESLLNADLPKWFVCVSKLAGKVSVAVKWKSAISYVYPSCCCFRQGSSLFLALFSLS